MTFAESFAPFFADYGTAATLAGVSVTGLLDVDTIDEGPGALTQRTSFLLQPTAAVAPAQGQTLVADATTYTVRQVLKEPPDGALTRLVLVRA